MQARIDQEFTSTPLAARRLLRRRLPGRPEEARVTATTLPAEVCAHRLVLALNVSVTNFLQGWGLGDDVGLRQLPPGHWRPSAIMSVEAKEWQFSRHRVALPRLNITR